MANRALARKKRCNILPISPKALATSDVIRPSPLRGSPCKHSSYEQIAGGQPPSQIAKKNGMPKHPVFCFPNNALT